MYIERNSTIKYKNYNGNPLYRNKHHNTIKWKKRVLILVGEAQKKNLDEKELTLNVKNQMT